MRSLPFLFLGISIPLFLAPPVLAAESTDMRISPRAFQCQQYEYAELDAMQKGELQGAFCSYVLGADQASKRNDLTKEKYADQPAILAPLLGDYIRFSENCSRGMEKTMDILSRKFSSQAPDCKPVIEKFEIAIAKRKAALSN